MRTALFLTAALAITIASAAAPPLLAQPAQTKPAPATAPQAARAASAEGFGIINATSPAPGLLFGGQPTEEQLQALGKAQYKTVIDLRGLSEDRGFDEFAAADAAGLEYIPLPITDETLHSANTLDAFIRIFRESEKPVFVHCAGGTRVAAAYYAWLVAEQKMTRDEALVKAKEAGLKSEKYQPLINEYLDLEAEKKP